MSLRRRLVLGFAVVALALVVGGFVLSRTMRGALLDRVDSQLRAVSGPLYVGGDGDDRRPPNVRSDYVIAVFDQEGNLQGSVVPPTASSDEPLPDVEAMAEIASQATPGRDVIATVPREDGKGSDYRVRAVTASQRGPEPDVVAVIGQSLADVDHTFRQIVVGELITAGVVLAALGLVAYWVLRQGVRPLDEIAEAADAIAAGDLSRRVSHPAASTEAGRVGIAFNRMLSQIEDDIRQRDESEQRLKQFAADASHELRTPLTSIRGYADLWRQGGLQHDGAIDDAMRRIEGESARMGRLVEDLLLLARLDEGIPLQRSPVDLSRIAHDVVSDARVVDPGRPITVEAEDAVVVIGDDDRLRQVLGNLVTNARTHTPAATPVRVSVRREEGSAIVEVHDDGPGMDDETAQRAFERFYRADKSRSRAQGGTGLGLSIVSAVVNALGGTVRLDSGVGRGTTFSIKVPLANV
jgi:two-component system OmpR family sensor kinase